MPPIMMLHPELANIMIGSRTRVMDVVRRLAQITGYKGVRYPWEQGVTGILEFDICNHHHQQHRHPVQARRVQTDRCSLVTHFVSSCGRRRRSSAPLNKFSI